jgi:hypothetical protein
MKVKILKPHKDQATGKRLKVGDLHEYENDFDLAHALAFKLSEPYDCNKVERAIKSTPEKRRGRPKKSVAKTDG